jgi:hypothetical protein
MGYGREECLSATSSVKINDERRIILLQLNRERFVQATGELCELFLFCDLFWLIVF